MRRAFVALITLALLLSAGAFLCAGYILTSPANRSAGSPPSDIPFEVIKLAEPSGGTISGWFSRGHPGFGGILLLHGIRSSRRQMLGRARFLHAEGYSVLLIDLPAHGESSAERITFGYREAAGVEAAMRFLGKALPGERLAVIGVSLGAASIVYAAGNIAPAAVVLESMYPTIEEAVTDRLEIWLGPVGRILAPPFLWELPLWIGVSSEKLNPIGHLSSLHAPVLIASGTSDRYTTLNETKRIFAAAAAPKELWLVDGAAHVDLYAFNPQAYKARISAFLSKYLRKQ